MKPIPLRASAPVQSDLFGAAKAPAPLTSLYLHRAELIELLSQLLWQVATRDDVVEQLEDADEQDQP